MISTFKRTKEGAFLPGLKFIWVTMENGIEEGWSKLFRTSPLSQRSDYLVSLI